MDTLNQLRATLLASLALSGCTPTPKCNDMTPITQTATGGASGWIVCRSDIALPERVGPMDQAPWPAESERGICDNPNIVSHTSECRTSADCPTELASCINSREPSTGDMGCVCIPRCETDADCAAGSVCVPAAEGLTETTRCVQATCETSDDCGIGQLCTLSMTSNEWCSLPEYSVHCTSPGQECVTASNCPKPDPGFFATCAFEPNGVGAPGRSCQDHDIGSYCGDGRPFLVDGQARTAQATASGSWSAPAAAAVALSDDARQTLVTRWTQAGLAEHASVAAFARFGLELLALGAPAHLLTATAAAMGEEVRHAELCFALASRYAGEAVGPGPLRLEGALDASIELEDVLTRVIHEACVGETIAAALATAAAEASTDADVVRALTEIAADETRHAILGWKTLVWAVRERPDLADWARDELDAACAAWSTGPAGRDRATNATRAHGALSGRERARVRRRAVRVVIRAAADAVFPPRSQRCQTGPLSPSGAGGAGRIVLR